jgi:hypothetical protein
MFDFWGWRKDERVRIGNAPHSIGLWNTLSCVGNIDRK